MVHKLDRTFSVVYLELFFIYPFIQTYSTLCMCGVVCVLCGGAHVENNHGASFVPSAIHGFWRSSSAHQACAGSTHTS